MKIWIFYEFWNISGKIRSLLPYQPVYSKEMTEKIAIEVIFYFTLYQINLVDFPFVD